MYEVRLPNACSNRILVSISLILLLCTVSKLSVLPSPIPRLKLDCLMHVTLTPAPRLKDLTWNQMLAGTYSSLKIDYLILWESSNSKLV